jgi:tetratricopeptide (TPR) repeat protein
LGYKKLRWPYYSLCDEMLSKKQADHLAFYYRGLCNECLKLYNNSIQDFEQSEKALNNYKRKSLFKEYVSLIPIQMSRVYKKMQDNKKAIEYADKAVQSDNNDVNGLNYRASLKEDFGDNIGALEDLNQALKRRPNNKSILKMRDRMSYIVIQEQRERSNR